MTTINKKERLVAAIKNGTVIDHIPADKTMQVVALLGLDTELNLVTIGYNYPSSKLGRKGIIKISDRYFTSDEINKLSVVAPNIAISIIKDYEVTDKFTVVTPEILRGIVRCNNPRCITNIEKIPTLFHVLSKGNVTLRCHYCDTEQKINDVALV